MIWVIWFRVDISAYAQGPEGIVEVTNLFALEKFNDMSSGYR